MLWLNTIGTGIVSSCHARSCPHILAIWNSEARAATKVWKLCLFYSVLIWQPFFKCDFLITLSMFYLQAFLILFSDLFSALLTCWFRRLYIIGFSKGVITLYNRAIIKTLINETITTMTIYAKSSVSTVEVSVHSKNTTGGVPQKKWSMTLGTQWGRLKMKLVLPIESKMSLTHVAATILLHAELLIIVE